MDTYNNGPTIEVKEQSDNIKNSQNETYYHSTLIMPITPITTPNTSPNKVNSTNQDEGFQIVKGSKQKEKLTKRNEKRRQNKLNEKVDIKIHVCSTTHRCKRDLVENVDSINKFLNINACTSPLLVGKCENYQHRIFNSSVKYEYLDEVINCIHKGYLNGYVIRVKFSSEDEDIVPVNPSHGNLNCPGPGMF